MYETSTEWGKIILIGGKTSSKRKKKCFLKIHILFFFLGGKTSNLTLKNFSAGGARVTARGESHFHGFQGFPEVQVITLY